MAKSDPLARALAALDAGREDEAIAALVEAWRLRRSPELAELVDLLDARQPQRPFASLVTNRADASVARLRAAATADDPRLSTAILAILATPPFIARTPAFWGLVMRIAERLVDPRIVPVTEDVIEALRVRLSPAGLRDDVVTRLKQLARKVKRAKAPTAGQAELEAAIASRLAKSRGARDRESELLDEIYSDPLADAPRLVYADVLLERGDPHGELITLQFKRRDHGLAEHEAARERELLKKHMKTWLRGLAPVLSGTQRYSNTTFERGFVCIADMQTSAERRLSATWQERAWATVEEVTGPFAHVVLVNAPLRGLRRIERIGIDQLALVERFANLEELGVVVRTGDPERLATLDGAPKLRRLEVVFARDRYSLADVAALLAMPLCSRIDRLVVSSYIVHQDLLAEERARFATLVAELANQPGLVREVALLPPWLRWPRPEPVLLARTATGYVTASK